MGLRRSRQPENSLIASRAALKASSGEVPLVSTFVSCVVRACWIWVSYSPIGGIFIWLAMSPKIWPTGALLK
jgi:hypothetical protein